MISSPRRPIDLWAGVECSVVRVGDRYRDQLAMTGHDTRVDDLDRIAWTGARAVRYPVLWERTAPDVPERADWSWADERLARLRVLGISPIVGLVHHGSGPRHTSLVDDSFIDGLAGFARAVARRYPWIRDYTPVNEPLTTARFSGLYGHWFPHGRDDATFVRALLVQCMAIARAMAAIREIVPEARLVQTEDFGTTYSTPRLAYQARFENLRRWLSLDLLAGRVDATHPLHPYLIESGADEARLAALREHPCPPDILGVNYYVTSDRFLDERLERYPSNTHGGNGRDAYVDVEAVRVRARGIKGFSAVLREAWDRYRIPTAITEAHLGCSREEQIRWLVEAWRGAEEARDAGADIRAVTVWSMFGAVDWSSLLTLERGDYEPGAFDVQGPLPRPTAIAHVARDLAERRSSDHPLLSASGWWHGTRRLLYPPHGLGARALAHTDHERAAPILVAGAGGALGRSVVAALQERALPFRALTREHMDIAHPDSVALALDRHKPWAVINAAGYAHVSRAEDEPGRCRRENVTGALVLMRACAERGIRLVAFSSHLVFDGGAREGYVESDAVAPLGVYGRSKVDAERILARLGHDALIVRSSAFFGPSGDGFVGRALRRLAAGAPVEARDDRSLSATYLPDLVRAVLDLLIDSASGVWHLVNAGVVSPFELARLAAEVCGVPYRSLVACRGPDPHNRCIAPLFSALRSERRFSLPRVEDALARYAQECTLAPARRGVA